MTRLLFVDDHPLYRAGVRLAIAQALPDVTIDLASTAEEALARLAAPSASGTCSTARAAGSTQPR